MVEKTKLGRKCGDDGDVIIEMVLHCMFKKKREDVPVHSGVMLKKVLYMEILNVGENCEFISKKEC